MSGIFSPADHSDLPAAIRELYSFGGQYFQSAAGSPQMHFVDTGPRDGKVVVLLHGNPTWSFYYRDVIRDLVAAGFRCIAPDHIGCGLSDKPQSGYAYRLGQRIADVEALLDALGVKSFSLVVHDWGGAIGSGVAGRRADAIERIVFLNTAAFRSKKIPWRIGICKVPLFGPFIVRAFNAFAGPAAKMSVRRQLPVAVRDGLLYPYRSWSDRIAVARFVQDIPLSPSHPSYETLHSVEQGLANLRAKPVLLAWGARDFCFTTHFLDRWKEFLPEAEVICREDCGHYVLEDGGAELRGQIVEFLQRS